MEEKQKRTRKPRSEEAKQAQREKMKARADANRELYGSATSPEHRENIKAGIKASPRGEMSDETKAIAAKRRQDTSKTKDFVSQLFSLLLELVSANKNEEVFLAFRETYPDMKAEKSKDGKHILISVSVRDLRNEHGVLAERIWKKMFTCVQTGGLSDSGDAFNSVWKLNEKVMDTYLMRRMATQRRTGEKFSVSQALEVLAEFDEIKRVATSYELEEVKIGKMEFPILKIVGKNKMETTRAERKEIAKQREELKKENKTKLTIEEQEILIEEIRLSIKK